MFTSFDKALAPLFVAGILAALGHFGVLENMTVGEAVTFIVASVLTYLVPNKRA